MPISVRRDVAPEYGLGDSFRLRSTGGFSTGSYLNHVRPRIADRNYLAFHESWGLSGSRFLLPWDAKEDIERDIQLSVTKALAAEFGLKRNRSSNEAIFDDLWPLLWKARQYKNQDDVKEGIAHDLALAYRFAGQIAAGRHAEGNPTTWARIVEKSTHSRYVIFSDHHMTAFDGFTLDNYFLDHNYELYLDVLRHYAALPEFCLVENGDVEECVIYQTTAEEAHDRKEALEALPIEQVSVDWKPFLELRYGKRRQSLQNIFDTFGDYYDLLSREFAGRYVRLTGNHDTYSDQQRERDLRDMIEAKLPVQVHDVLRIRLDSGISHVVMHGHQFDTVSLQHGAIAYGLSLGEVFSEAASWIYQGADRFWSSPDAKKWINGWSYGNRLAREVYSHYEHDLDDSELASALDLALAGGTGEPVVDLLASVYSDLDNIKDDSRGFVETLLKHEIAWEYFENEDAFHALALEVATGDEFFKFRHLNERELCRRYREAFHDEAGSAAEIPTLILGHTHEPRQDALNPETGDTCAHYLNSGSAGRFENLIWGVEITRSGDHVVSWSRSRRGLKKITWRSAEDTLVHQSVDYFD